MINSDIRSHIEDCDGLCSLYECDCSLHDIKQYNAIIEENLREDLQPTIDPKTGETIEVPDSIPF